MTHLSPSLHRITRFKPLPAGWWCQTRGAALEAIPAVPAVAVILSAGVATHHAPAALIAAGGAMSIGFGAYKKVESSPLPATVLAHDRLRLAAVAGSLLGHSLATSRVHRPGWRARNGRGIAARPFKVEHGRKPMTPAA